MSLAPVALLRGRLFPRLFDRAAQEALREEVQAILAVAPLFRPRMPHTGRPFSVRMSNRGPLGWVSDEGSYRYQLTHPETGRPWPRCRRACSWPLRRSRRARRMGLHQDRDEEELAAPVVSLSLGDT